MFAPGAVDSWSEMFAPHARGHFGGQFEWHALVGCRLVVCCNNLLCICLDRSMLCYIVPSFDMRSNRRDAANENREGASEVSELSGCLLGCLRDGIALCDLLVDDMDELCGTV